MTKGKSTHIGRLGIKLTSPSKPTEYMQIQDTYSPVLHRIDQAVRWRAIHPNDPIPPPYEILVRYSHPPEELVNKSKRRLERLVAAADVKKGKEQPSPDLFE